MRESYLRKTETRNDNIINLGFDYKGKIFSKTMSKTLLEDPIRKPILEKIETMIFNMIELVKSIKTNINYAVKKDHTKIN